MKTYSQIQKMISTMLVFFVLIEFTGCYTTRILTPSQIISSDKYIIYGKNSILPVENVMISDSFLTCNPDISKNNYDDSYKIRIFLSTDTNMKISNDIISIPVNNILSIEQKVPSKSKTRTLTTVLIVAGAVGVVAGIIIIVASLVKETTAAADECIEIPQMDCSME